MAVTLKEIIGAVIRIHVSFFPTAVFNLIFCKINSKKKKFSLFTKGYATVTNLRHQLI